MRRAELSSGVKSNATIKRHYMYNNGTGVTQNDTEAAKWFRLAADQGYAKAQNNLGTLFARGQGVPRDYVQAYLWFDLSQLRRATRQKIEKPPQVS